MNFDYDPKRHPPEVGRAIQHMSQQLSTGKRGRQDVIGALCDGIEFVADQDGVAYEVIETIVFAALDRDNGKQEPVQ